MTIADTVMPGKIKRRSDSSIDTGFYLDRARRIRSDGYYAALAGLFLVVRR